VSELDRDRWDAKHASADTPSLADVALPAVFAPFEARFPRAGRALELACGRGGTAVWLAKRGLDVLAGDVSSVAISAARELADLARVADRCEFIVTDLDDGLPSGPSVDVVVCHLFRDPGLDAAIMERLAPGGLLAMACLSEVGAEPGPFRARPGELLERFAALDVLAFGESDGRTWLLSRRAPRSTPGAAST
jgi:SAM-dependent methyltransferase